MLVLSAALDPVKTPGLSKKKPIGKEPVVELKANPEWAVKIVPTCPPPISSFSALLTLPPMKRPRPKGKSYTPFATKKCVASKSDGPRQTRRLVASHRSGE